MAFLSRLGRRRGPATGAMTGNTSNHMDKHGSATGPMTGTTGTHMDKHEKTGHRSKPGKKRSKRPLFDKSSGHFNRRPSFGQWLKGTVLDIVTMIILGAIGLGVYFADPAPSRSFPVTFANGEIVYPEFAYPLRKEIIPIWAAALLGALVPIFFFLVMQFRIKSFWDVNNAVLGLLYSLISAAVFQVFLKWLIGGLRPHFLDVCQPDPNLIAVGGNGYGQIMFDRSICTGDAKQINDSLESFPSGHSTAAFAGFIFLFLYLNAKLKVFSNHHPAMWKLVVTYMPVLAATLIAGALTIDKFHNWYDCLAGAVIGTMFAISAYRMVYASVWDFRFNHIPLTRHTPFSYGAGAPGAAGFERAVFSRSAGWGTEEAFGGAPFDSAYLLRGQPTPLLGDSTHSGGIHGGGMHGRGMHNGGMHNGAMHNGAMHNGGIHTGGMNSGRMHNGETRTGSMHDGGVYDEGMYDRRTHGTERGRESYRADDVEYNSAEAGMGSTSSANRYKHHRKSVERKAIPNQTTTTHDNYL